VSDRILLVHHFSLATVTGVRALIAELLWRIPMLAPGTRVMFEPYEASADAAAFVARLATQHREVTAVVGVNTHVDLKLDHTIAWLEWCRRTGRRAYLYVHDYWPQHGPLLASLVERYGCELLASTAFIRDAMRADGLHVVLVPVGISLQNLERGAPVARDPGGPRIVGTVARVVARKRLVDVVTAFCSAGLADRAKLRMRLLSSGVNPVERDDEIIRAIEAVAEAQPGRDRAAVILERSATDRADYRDYDVYACASSYEGFSMTPIEAAYSGCPPLMSDIPAHRAIATALFGEGAHEFLFPVGDVMALGHLMRDEIHTGRRGLYARSRLRDVRALVETRWSPAVTAAALIEVVVDVRSASTHRPTDTTLPEHEIAPAALEEVGAG
jgi:glycosyltransferase involved in cell wall biosynthesis